LQEHLAKVESEKLAVTPAFASKDVYDQTQRELLQTIVRGELEKVREIVA